MAYFYWHGYCFYQGEVRTGEAGLLYGSLKEGDGIMAKSLFIRKAILRVLEMLFGVHHPLVAKYLNYLGRHYNTKGNIAKAELFYVRSLQIREDVFGPEHPNVADSLNRLAGLYDEMKDFNKSKNLYQRVKKINQEHPNEAVAC
jgi:tetratricopeptide (TPR) repeat protein